MNMVWQGSHCCPPGCRLVAPLQDGHGYDLWELLVELGQRDEELLEAHKGRWAAGMHTGGWLECCREQAGLQGERLEGRVPASPEQLGGNCGVVQAGSGMR